MASEATFPTRRALQIAQSRFNVDAQGAQRMLDNIYLTPAECLEDIEHFALVWSRGLAKKLRNEASNHPLGLLIIDSIAAPIRTEYSNDSAGFRQRGSDLNVFGENLKQLSHELNLCIVVVNHVSDVVQRPGSLMPFHAEDQLKPADNRTFARSIEMSYSSAAPEFASHALNKTKQASLGLVWANQVDVRLCLLNSTRRTTGESMLESRIRHFCVVFSPFSPSYGPSSYVDCIISASGMSACRHTSGLVRRLKGITNPSQTSSSSEIGSVSITSTPPDDLGKQTQGQLEEEERMWKLLDQDVDLTQVDMETL